MSRPCCRANGVAWTTTVPRRRPRVVVADQCPRNGNGVRMEIETTRFGRLTVDDDRIITFPRGLLGFPDRTQFALIQTGEENYFFWLQSVEDANLAFVVTDPTIFFKDYEVPLREEMRQDLELADASTLQVFVICNK